MAQAEASEVASIHELLVPLRQGTTRMKRRAQPMLAGRARGVVAPLTAIALMSCGGLPAPSPSLTNATTESRPILKLHVVVVEGSAWENEPRSRIDDQIAAAEVALGIAIERGPVRMVADNSAVDVFEHSKIGKLFNHDIRAYEKVNELCHGGTELTAIFTGVAPAETTLWDRVRRLDWFGEIDSYYGYAFVRARLQCHRAPSRSDCVLERWHDLSYFKSEGKYFNARLTCDAVVVLPIPSDGADYVLGHELGHVLSGLGGIDHSEDLGNLMFSSSDGIESTGSAGATPAFTDPWRKNAMSCPYLQHPEGEQVAGTE